MLKIGPLGLILGPKNDVAIYAAFFLEPNFWDNPWKRIAHKNENLTFF
jgi:hypothetical protein